MRTRHSEIMRTTQSGIALIAVLAILTVLALLAASFTIFMTIETKSGTMSMAKVQADLLAQSAFEHALGQLNQDVTEQPAWDNYSEPWSAGFKPGRGIPGDAVSMYGAPEAENADAQWIYVKRGDDTLIGRYAVLIEDEAGKINANVAASLSAATQNEGVGTFEILLTDGGERGLPLSKAFGNSILSYRYGRDRAPGQVRADDNNTIVLYGSDQIDNNANGTTDENGEGIDEQIEYNASRPAWDDRSFSSITELLTTCAKERPLSLNAQAALRKYATVYSRGDDKYYDERDGVLRKQININVGSREQVRRLIRRANAESRFEPTTARMLGLVANIIDYRDENHVLTTVGNEYGVEAINFNEIMANDGSYSMEADTSDYGSWWHRYNGVHRYGLWYNYPGNAMYGFNLKSVSAQGGGGACLVLGKPERFGSSARVQLASEPGRVVHRTLWADFKKIRNVMGGFPVNLFRNGELVLTDRQNVTRGRYPILGNDRQSITVATDDSDSMKKYAELVGAATNTYLYARLDTHWNGSSAAWCVYPETADQWSFPVQTDPKIKPPDDLYYYTFVGEQNFVGTLSDNQPWQGFYPYMDLDGDQNSYKESKMVELTRENLKGSEMKLPEGADRTYMKRYPYNNGEAIRARGGYVHMLVSTAKKCGYVGGRGATSDAEAYCNKNTFDVVYIMRPDIIELINISDRDISLRNWRVVINTGAYADQVAQIDSASHYSRAQGGRYDDPNPVIKPNGYFYLTNKRDIFDYEYGSKQDGEWGSDANETFPCFELPDHLWGVRYKITRVASNRLYVEGASWRDNQMKFEMQEIHSTRKQAGRNGVTGVRKSVYSSGKNWLEAQPGIYWPADGVEAGDDVLIVGMPRQGGFLSMTLKNEYAQIAARTIEYGSVEPQELNYSTEKYDPTHYTWVKSSQPTFGGKTELARNTSDKQMTATKAFVKNCPFSSVGEIRKVRKASDWENIGMTKKGTRSTQHLKALAKYFTTSGMRLDAEEEGAHLSGWNPAFGKVAIGGKGQFRAEDVSWEPDIWAGMKVRITGGSRNGEEYVVGRNTENAV